MDIDNNRHVARVKLVVNAAPAGPKRINASCPRLLIKRRQKSLWACLRRRGDGQSANKNRTRV